MYGVLAILFIAVPAVEIYLLIAVGTEIGALATFGIIAATGALGAVLARSQGLSAVRGLQGALATGSGVGRAALEAALVLIAAVLLLTPGLVTDAVGFGLLMPPVRRAVARALVRRYAARAARVVVGPIAGFRVHDPDGDAPPSERDRDPPPPGVIDV